MREFTASKTLFSMVCTYTFPARPFQEWSIENSSGAQRRSGLDWGAKADHAFVPPNIAAVGSDEEAT